MRTTTPGAAGMDHPARVLLPLLGIYALGTVSLQGFNLVYLRVAADIGAGDSSGLITAIPGIVLGVACFLYGTLGDFVPLRRIVDVGVALIVAGSLLGFTFSSSLTGIIIARALQTLGYQASASAYMILATGIADHKRRSLYVGLMCAAFQGGTAIGMLSGGLLADINWAILLLIPLGGLAVLPIMGRRVPARAHTGRVDVVGLAIFSSLALLLTLAASNPRWWLIGGLILGGVIFWRYIGRARAPFITRSFFTNVPWARSVSLIVIIYCMNFTVAPPHERHRCRPLRTHPRAGLRAPPARLLRRPDRRHEFRGRHGPHRARCYRAWLRQPHPVRNRDARPLYELRPVGHHRRHVPHLRRLRRALHPHLRHRLRHRCPRPERPRRRHE